MHRAITFGHTFVTARMQPDSQLHLCRRPVGKRIFLRHQLLGALRYRRMRFCTFAMSSAFSSPVTTART